MHKLNLNQSWRVLNWLENLLVGGMLTFIAGIFCYFVLLTDAVPVFLLGKSGKVTARQH